MTKNPILDELHAIREKLLDDAGGTLDALVDRLQAEEQTIQSTSLPSTTNNPMQSSGDCVQRYGKSTCRRRLIRNVRSSNP